MLDWDYRTLLREQSCCGLYPTKGPSLWADRACLDQLLYTSRLSPMCLQEPMALAASRPSPNTSKVDLYPSHEQAHGNLPSAAPICCTSCCQAGSPGMGRSVFAQCTLPMPLHAPQASALLPDAMLLNSALFSRSFLPPLTSEPCLKDRLTPVVSANEERLHPYQCRWAQCACRFQEQDDLVYHVNEKHVKIDRPDVDYQCRWDGCPRRGRGFNARYKMLIHIRTHTNEKPHTCLICKKSFSRLENLKIHNRSHTGEKPYICPFEGCNKAYSNSSDRFKHVRTHQEQKPYICKMPGCHKRYTDPSSLRKHVRTHGHFYRSGEKTSPPSSSSTGPSMSSLSSSSSSSSSSSPPSVCSLSGETGKTTPANVGLIRTGASTSPPINLPLSPSMLTVNKEKGWINPTSLTPHLLPLNGSIFPLSASFPPSHFFHPGLVTSSSFSMPVSVQASRADSVPLLVRPMPISLARLDSHKTSLFMENSFGHLQFQDGPLDLSRSHLSPSPRGRLSEHKFPELLHKVGVN